MGVSKAAVEIALCVERRVLPTQALLGSKSGQRKHTEKPHHALITHEVHSKLLLLSTLKLSETATIVTFYYAMHALKPDSRSLLSSSAR